MTTIAISVSMTASMASTGTILLLAAMAEMQKREIRVIYSIITFVYLSKDSTFLSVN
jgi:hypothetical protein